MADSRYIVPQRAQGYKPPVDYPNVPLPSTAGLASIVHAPSTIRPRIADGNTDHVMGPPEEGPKKYMILVDSRDRNYALYPDTNYYRVRLDTAYKEVHVARVVNMHLPALGADYTVTPGNNTMVVFDGLSNKFVTVPVGEYTIAEFTAAVQVAFNGLAGPSAYTVELLPSDLFRISSSMASGAFTIVSGDLAALLGYDLAALPLAGSSAYTATVPATAITAPVGLSLRVNIPELGLSARATARQGVEYSDRGVGGYVEHFPDLERVTDLTVEWRDVTDELYDGFMGREHSVLLEIITTS
jgi:hypothetical protein